MKLYDHQQKLLDANPRYHGLFWEVGTGKTLTSIKLAEKQDINSCLIVCPKSLVANWRRELDKWGSDLRDISWLVVSKEDFRRDWEKLTFANQGIIIDEAHYFEGHKSKMHKNMVKWLKKNNPFCVYLLTGTPYLSSPFNIMCLEKLLGRKTNWKTYSDKFFTHIRMGGRMIPQIKKGIEKEIADIVNSLGSTIKKEECLDLPDQVFLREDFEMTPEQKKEVKLLDEDATTANHIAYWTRRHQVCGGTIKNDQYKDGYKMFKSSKLVWVKEFSLIHPSFAVVCRYNAELAMLKQAIPHAEVLNGNTKNRQEVIDKVNADPNGVLLINAALSEGYNLTGVDKMVFYSNGFSHKDRVQMIGRIHRIGQTKKCTYIDLVTAGDIDEDVMKSLTKKEDFSLEIYKK